MGNTCHRLATLLWLLQLSLRTTVAWTDDEANLEEGLTCAGIDLTQKDDLPNFDLLRRFQLDVDGSSVGAESIEGTDSVQAAYRLNKDSQFAVATSDIFPSGLPGQFSFSCTFRKTALDNRPWTLLRINNYNGDAQFGLAMLPQEETIRFYIAQGDESEDYSHLEKFNFERVPLNKATWNKVHLSIYAGNVTLYVNCQKVGHFSLKPKHPVDVSGDTWLAKYDDDLSTVPLDIQWMVMNCDASRPQRDTCSEISSLKSSKQTYQTNSLLKSEHNYVTVIEPQCCQETFSSEDIKELVLSVLKENLESLASQFRGPPGKNGQPGKSKVGPPGIRGEKGDTGPMGGRGFHGAPGAQGKDGRPGEKGDKGEVGEKGFKGDTGEEGHKGPQGRRGVRGPPGFGQPGHRGERGPSGNPGVEGSRGPQGPVGPPGVCEMCKTFNMDTLQLILSQGQRQMKGPNTKSA